MLFGEPVVAERRVNLKGLSSTSIEYYFDLLNRAIFKHIPQLHLGMPIACPSESINIPSFKPLILKGILVKMEILSEGFKLNLCPDATEPMSYPLFWSQCYSLQQEYSIILEKTTRSNENVLALFLRESPLTS